MKKVAAAAAVLLALTGCTSAPEPESEPEIVEPSPNLVACDTAQDLSKRLAQSIVDKPDAEFLEGVRGEFDTLGLEASGEVQVRLYAVRDSIIEHPILWMSQSASEYFTALEDLGRACIAEFPDYEYGLHTWS